MYDCCMCGSDLGEELITLTDLSPGGSTLLSLLEEILEGEEKELVPLLNSGDICRNCSNLLESIEIYLLKLSEIKIRIINTYNQLLSKEAEVETAKPEKETSPFQRERLKHERGKGRKRKKGVKEEDEGREGQALHDEDMKIFALSLGGSHCVGELRYEEDPPFSPAEPLSREQSPELGPSSPARLSSPRIKLFDIVLEETSSSELTLLSLDLDPDMWNSVFFKPIKEKGCLSHKWKSVLTPLIAEHIKDCSLELVAAQQPGQAPSFTGFCSSQTCSRTIKVRVTEEQRLDLQFSGGDCSSEDSEASPGVNSPSVTKLCDYCLLEFNSLNPQHVSQIREHLTQCHSIPETQEYSCKCGRKFTKKGARNFHYNRCSSNDAVEHTCEYCGKTLRSLPLLKLHTKHCKRNVMCEICSKLFSTGRKLEEHMYMIHENPINIMGIREYPCDQCDKVFTKKYNLQSHKLMHSDSKPFVCPEEDCGKRFKREVTLRLHRDAAHQHKTNVVYCEFCTAQFKSTQGLRLHVASVHEIGPVVTKRFGCDQCDKTFKCFADLKVHVVTHTKEKAFVCNLCAQKFARNSSLTEHTNVHRMKYKCEWCEKCFGRERYLKAHVTSCPMCPTRQDTELKQDDPIFRPDTQETVQLIQPTDTPQTIQLIQPADTQQTIQFIQPADAQQAIQLIQPADTQQTIQLIQTTDTQQTIQLIQPADGQSIHLIRPTDVQSIQLIQSTEGRTIQLIPPCDGQTIRLIQSAEGQVLALTVIKDHGNTELLEPS